MVCQASPSAWDDCVAPQDENAFDRYNIVSDSDLEEALKKQNDVNRAQREKIEDGERGDVTNISQSGPPHLQVLEVLEGTGRGEEI